jgi:hypothetical protein
MMEVAIASIFGVRVGVRETVHSITYTVFTKAGKYNVPESASSSYQIHVLENGYQSPVEKVTLPSESANLPHSCETRLAEGRRICST